MKKLKKSISTLIDYVTSLIHSSLHSEQQRCRILEFHSISDDFSGRMPTLSPIAFQRFMEYIYNSKYKVISLSHLVECLEQIKPLPKNSLVITFDDGYKDNFLTTLPILKKYDFSAIIFLVTGWIGKNPACLSWEEVKQMHSSGISFGSHTDTHLHLTKLPPEKLEHELKKSKEIIENKLGTECWAFSYPYGKVNESIREKVKKIGYKCAVSKGEKSNTLRTPLFELSRTFIYETDITPHHFRVRLSGAHQWRRLWS